MRIAPPVLAVAMVGLALASLAALTRQGPSLMPAQPGALLVRLEPRHPIPEPPLRGLPSADRSDEALRSALEKTHGGPALVTLLAEHGLVTRIVATVDALGGTVLPRAWLPMVPPGEFPLAYRTPLTQRHFVRYEPYVRALESADLLSLASLYVRMYPLFQDAWSRRAGGERHFNDALVAAIDHLLDTPSMPQPPVVVRRRGRMVFEDPALERRSAGQKLLLRMGEQNARRVKAVLAEVRRRVALRPDPG
jgi:hypothetical protein